MTAISIDRLVLDIPGLDPAQGKRLAERIAEGLSVGLAGDVEGGDRTRLSVTLDRADAGHGATDRAGVHPPRADGFDRLADRAVALLLQQIG